jgi:hypothetical protein
MRYIYEIIVRDEDIGDLHGSIHRTHKGAMRMKDRLLKEIEQEAKECPEDDMAFGMQVVYLYKRTVLA